MSIQEQAKFFAAQGMLCRAGALYRKLIETEPTAENFNALGEIYLEQGLDEEASDCFIRAFGATPAPKAASTGLVN